MREWVSAVGRPQEDDLEVIRLAEGIRFLFEGPFFSDAQDADVVLLLWKPDGDSPGPVDKVEVVIAKNRNGRTGVVGVAFRKASMRFETAEPALTFPERANGNGVHQRN